MIYEAIKNLPRNRAEVHITSEYRTSKTCSNCFEIAPPTKKKILSNYYCESCDQYFDCHHSICPNCEIDCKAMYKGTHRYQFCPRCHIHQNRDINAGRNIIKRGYHEHFDKKLPKVFKKSGNLQQLFSRNLNI